MALALLRDAVVRRCPRGEGLRRLGDHHPRSDPNAVGRRVRKERKTVATVFLYSLYAIM